MKIINNKKSNKTNFLTSFLSYYIIILCIPLLIGIGLYYYSQNVIQNEVIRANKLVIEQLKLTIDHKLESMREFTMQLEVDESLKGIINIKDELTTGNRYTLLHLVSTYSAYNLSNDFIDDFFIYCKKSQTIIGPYGYQNVKGITDSRFYDATWYFPQWSYIVRKEHRNELYPVILENTEKIDSIIYLQTLPFNKNHDPQALVAIKIKKDYFESILKSTQFSIEKNINFAIIDKNKNVLFTHGKSNIIQSVINNNEDKVEDGFIDVSKNNDYYIYTVDSNISDWSYVTIIPSRVFNSRISGVRTIALSSLILILILGSMAIFWVKRRRYDPLASTLNLFKNEKHVFGNDAYSFLMSTVEKTLNDKSNMEENMLTNRDYLQSYFLMRLISQKITDENEYLRLIDYYGIDLNFTYTSVVIFYQNTQEDRILRENEAFIEFLKQIKAQFLLSFNSSEGGLANFYPVYFNGMLVCLINYSQTIHERDGIITWLNSFKKDMDKIDLSVSLSNPKTDLIKINVAYNEALQALESKLVFGKSGFCQYDDSNNCKKITHIMYYQYEDNFTALLDSGEYEKAKHVINNLFNLILNQENMNINIVKCRMFGIINILMNTIEKLNFSNDIISFDELYLKLVKFHSISELREEIIIVLIDVIKNHAKKNNCQSINNIITDVIKFIGEHYLDPNLSVSQIADYFKIDISILSRKFKKNMEVNISDYIHLQRLKKAKPMIKETKETIKTIAVKCGYFNSDIFIRVFKRYEGITPGKYRQSN